MTPAAGFLADRLPPQNLEAEAGVLGSCLLDNSALDEVIPLLAAEDFYRDAHQAVYRAVREVYGRGTPVDGLTLADELTRRGGIAAVGGIEFIAELVNSVPHSANARYYAEIVRQKAVSRALVEGANETLREAYSNNFTSEELLNRAEGRFYAVAEAETSGDTVRAGDVVTGVLGSIYARAEGEFVGLTSGLHDLDDVTCGFQPGNLIYLAGRTSMGKTALALNVVDHVCVEMDYPVLLVTLEMSRAEIVERLIVLRSGVDGHLLRTGRVRGHQAALTRAHDAIKRAPLFIDDAPGRTAHQVAANARRYRSREDVRLVVVDLINHVAGDNPRVSRREQMGPISRRFKALARELKVPVLVLAQLNRGPDNREGNRPRKSDLKECGNLEEDADLVLLLHRPEYYDPNDSPGQAVVIVDKNRNGPTRDVRVAYHKPLMKFEGLARHADPGFVPAADF